MKNKPLAVLISIFLILPIILFAQQELEDAAKVLIEQGKALVKKRIHAKTYEEKITLLIQAKKYFRKAGDWENLIKTKCDLATQYGLKQDYKKFDAQVKKLKILLAAHEVPDQRHYSAKEIFAWHSLIKEDYLASEQLYKEVYDYKVKKADKIGASRSANNFGFFYMNYVSDYERAIDYFQKSIRLYKESNININSQLALLYSNLGVAYKQSGSDKVAFTYLRKSLQILQDQNNQNLNIQTKWWNYQNLSDLHLNNEAFDSCFYYGQKALAILKEGKNFPDDYQNYHTLGNYYLKTGDYSTALGFFQNGLERASKHADVFRPINAIVNLADVLSKHKEHQVALDSLQVGLQLLCPEFRTENIFTNPPVESFAHKKSALKLIEKRAAIFYRKYKEDQEISLLQSSLENYQLAAEIIHLIRQDYVGDISKYFLAEKVLSIYESAIDVAHELYESTGKEKYIEAAFHFAEMNKSVLLTESIKENTAKGFGYLPDSILQKERDLKLEVMAIKKNIYKVQKSVTADKSQIKPLSDELFVLKENYNDLIATLEKQYPKYYELKHQATIASIGDLQKHLLDHQTALLEYFVGAENIFIFCIQKNKARFFKIEKPDDLLTSFNQLRSIISKAPDSESYAEDLQKFNQVAYGFYNLLLQDAIAEINSRHLIIVPDDLLIYLPFEVLLTKDTAASGFSLSEQSYLLEDFNINYSFSSTMLLNTKDLFYSAQKDFVGFAPSFKNPLLQASRNCSDGDLYSLQCSEQEVLTINSLFEGNVFSKSDASKDNFESIVGNYNVIHLATHACVDEANPDFSRIYFADDFLSSFDLTNMRIHANLAVLSACNTNVGPLMKGDGVSSISKGFLMAGCPSILTSLWSVDDCSTSELMINFYQSLKKGATKSKALRQAKLDYLQEADPVNAHPYYWAPFLLSGQDQAIVISGSNNSWMWIGGGILMIVILFFSFRNRSLT